MRIAIISPFSQGPSRGNITTVNRISRNLASSGEEVRIIPVDSSGNSQFDLIPAFAPHILHAFHAYYCGPAARSISETLNIPYLITITGSDIFEPAFRGHPETALAIRGASAVICFDSIVEEELIKAFPSAMGKTAIVPQGVEPLSPDPSWARNSSDFIILLPAALRPAKGIIEAIDALSPLADSMPDLRLIIAGGDIDRDYAARVREAVSGKGFTELAGDVPHQEMGGLYNASDVVLNASIFEGGMSNALLEAMIMSRPVLASDIPGNRSVVWHGETGWLYRDHNGLREIISMLAEKPDLRESAGRAGFFLVKNSFSADVESMALKKIYNGTANYI